MKHIVKGLEPAGFAAWKSKGNADWQPTYSLLSGETKKLVKDALVEEQGNICCYCERRLSDDDSHIEHFMPQGALGVDGLDFANLMCSCQQQIKKRMPRHCGNSKGDLDPAALVSPFDANCASHFGYTLDGTIKTVEAGDRAAEETIESLSLNIKKLKALRKAAIAEFLETTERLSAQEFENFVDTHLSRNERGEFGEFWTTIHWVFRGPIGQVSDPQM